MEHDCNIEKIITTLLTSMGFSECSVVKKERHGRVVWDISVTKHADLLGRQDVVRSLSYLVQKIVEKQGVHVYCTIDINGAQEAKVREIESKATLLAERVRTFRSRAEMIPMNSYERMVVHTLFSNDPEITTTSEGEGEQRHVVLEYADKK